MLRKQSVQVVIIPEFFFSNQFIKSSTRADVEKEQSDKYGIKVEIFDGLWCANAVFIHGCIY